MAVFKQRLLRKNSSNGYDTVYLETSSDMVIRPDGTTVENSLTKIQHTVNSIQTTTPPDKPNISSAAQGDILTWCNRQWRVILVNSVIVVLALHTIEERLVAYPSNSVAGTTGFDPFTSPIILRCMTFAKELNLTHANYLMDWSTSSGTNAPMFETGMPSCKVFLCSPALLNKSYYNTSATDTLKCSNSNNWWMGRFDLNNGNNGGVQCYGIYVGYSAYTDHGLWLPDFKLGFRPHVAILK